jgi:hypothetical protein
MKRAFLALPLFALGACAGGFHTPAPSHEACLNAQAAVHNAKLVRDGIGLTPEHYFWANAVVIAAEATVNAVCPPDAPALAAPADAPVLP